MTPTVEERKHVVLTAVAGAAPMSEAELDVVIARLYPSGKGKQQYFTPGKNPRAGLLARVPGQQVVLSDRGEQKLHGYGPLPVHLHDLLPVPTRAGEPVVTQEAYRSAALRDLTDLERDVVTRQRTEQAFLRQHLLQRRPAAECAFCGRCFPADLLVAAHIQRRTDLTDEQKLRFDEIAVLACAAGCDRLFELGYLTVDDDGVVRATAADVPADLRRLLHERDGRRCSGHTPARAAHFAHHRRARGRG